MIYVEATFGSSVDTVRHCQVAVSDVMHLLQILALVLLVQK